jgi:hypothetical protein
MVAPGALYCARHIKNALTNTEAITMLTPSGRDRVATTAAPATASGDLTPG